jgi:hypothetical protein
MPCQWIKADSGDVIRAQNIKSLRVAAPFRGRYEHFKTLYSGCGELCTWEVQEVCEAVRDAVLAALADPHSDAVFDVRPVIAEFKKNHDVPEFPR